MASPLYSTFCQLCANFFIKNSSFDSFPKRLLHFLNTVTGIKGRDAMYARTKVSKSNTKKLLHARVMSSRIVCPSVWCDVDVCMTVHMH